MKTLFNTYSLIFGMILGISFINAGYKTGENLKQSSGELLVLSVDFVTVGAECQTQGTDSQKTTFYSNVFGLFLNNDLYRYQEQKIVLSPKNNRSHLGYYTHLKI